jgi:hypothetical protein
MTQLVEIFGLDFAEFLGLLLIDYILVLFLLEFFRVPLVQVFLLADFLLIL